MCHEWRDAASPFRTGPSVSVDDAGQVTASGQPFMAVPHSQWVHFEVTCDLGKQADGTWSLTVTVPGQPPQLFAKLPCDPRCRELQWMGFISNATDTAVCYLDNLKLSVKQ